jgi:hypothetical protein
MNIITNPVINPIYNHRLFHLINQSNKRMLSRTHISCKNINPDINYIIDCMFNFNCNSCSTAAGGTGGTGGAGGNGPFDER